MAYDAEGKPIYWKDAAGQPCWFANGIPAVNGMCVWCGTPSSEHRPPDSASSEQEGK